MFTMPFRFKSSIFNVTNPIQLGTIHESLIQAVFCAKMAVVNCFPDFLC